MGLVKNSIQGGSSGDDLGYDGSYVDLLAMMAIEDYAAVGKAIEAWSLAGEYEKAAGFVVRSIQEEQIGQLTEVFSYILQNWSIQDESLALLLMSVMQTKVKADVLAIIVNAMVSSRDKDVIIPVLKYAYFEADESIAVAFAELVANSAQDGVCRLGQVMSQVTFGLTDSRTKKLIELFEKVGGDVCIVSFASAIDVARGITKAAPQECVEVPPPGGYTCAQQLQFNKCERHWMVTGGYCQVTCGTCGRNSCVDVQPTSQYTCSQQKQFGKCQAVWMMQGGYCNYTCDRCPNTSDQTPAHSPALLLPPSPLPSILLPPSPPGTTQPGQEPAPMECQAMYNQTVDIIAVMLNEVVNRILQSLQT
eukprot:TRINITY_DN16286_c1_g1_i4.p1 TRINITY_DN16286_c1_g1~~TRINITY_DN16286_c1_g1_i4.p1  ORF type:complete len:363 (-),score=35.91 TRINITY_DN16286_c1_g1_i4:775-1863(-)